MKDRRRMFIANAFVPQVEECPKVCCTPSASRYATAFLIGAALVAMAWRLA